MPDWLHNIEAFQRRLAETVTWSAKHASTGGDPEHCLRDNALRPPQLTNIRNPEERAVAMERMAAIRSELLTRHRGFYGDSSQSAMDGRLLLYNPDQNAADGAAQNASEGLLDVDNEPPWDAWVCYIEQDLRLSYWQSYLVSWIPKEFIELAARGIEVNPEGCIAWASDADTAFTRLLRSAGLL